MMYEQELIAEIKERRSPLKYDSFGNPRVSPCENCTIKNGYGGKFRCDCCEVNLLKKEYERLTKQVESLKKRIKEEN